MHGICSYKLRKNVRNKILSNITSCSSAVRNDLSNCLYHAYLDLQSARGHTILPYNASHTYTNNNKKLNSEYAKVAKVPTQPLHYVIILLNYTGQYTISLQSREKKKYKKYLDPCHFVKRIIIIYVSDKVNLKPHFTYKQPT